MSILLEVRHCLLCHADSAFSFARFYDGKLFCDNLEQDKSSPEPEVLHSANPPVLFHRHRLLRGQAGGNVLKRYSIFSGSIIESKVDRQIFLLAVIEYDLPARLNIFP